MRNPRRAYDANGREIAPMTLANMRENGTRSVEAKCEVCGHEAVVNVDAWPADYPVPDGGSSCGARPAGQSGSTPGRTGPSCRGSSSGPAAQARLVVREVDILSHSRIGQGPGCTQQADRGEHHRLCPPAARVGLPAQAIAQASAQLGSKLTLARAFGWAWADRRQARTPAAAAPARLPPNGAASTVIRLPDGQRSATVVTPPPMAAGTMRNMDQPPWIRALHLRKVATRIGSRLRAHRLGVEPPAAPVTVMQEIGRLGQPAEP